jgi:hypothetical protein
LPKISTISIAFLPKFSTTSIAFYHFALVRSRLESSFEKRIHFLDGLRIKLFHVYHTHCLSINGNRTPYDFLNKI